MMNDNSTDKSRLNGQIDKLFSKPFLVHLAHPYGHCAKVKILHAFFFVAINFLGPSNNRFTVILMFRKLSLHAKKNQMNKKKS